MRLLFLREKAPSSDLKKKFKPHQLVHIPAIRSKKRSFSIPKSSFDYLLVSSQNVARFHKKFPSFNQCVCVGQKTKQALAENIKKDSISLKESNRDGILKFFRQKKPGRIFYPRSALSDQELIQKLRSFGHKVSAPIAYETEILNIRPALKKKMSRAPLDVVLVTSPSILTSLKRSMGPAFLRQWKVQWIAIGPTTAKSLKELGISCRWPKIAKIEKLAGFLKTSKS